MAKIAFLALGYWSHSQWKFPSHTCCRWYAQRVYNFSSCWRSNDMCNDLSCHSVIILSYFTHYYIVHLTPPTIVWACAWDESFWTMLTALYTWDLGLGLNFNQCSSSLELARMCLCMCYFRDFNLPEFEFWLLVPGDMWKTDCTCLWTIYLVSIGW